MNAPLISLSPGLSGIFGIPVWYFRFRVAPSVPAIDRSPAEIDGASVRGQASSRVGVRPGDYSACSRRELQPEHVSSCSLKTINILRKEEPSIFVALCVLIVDDGVIGRNESVPKTNGSLVMPTGTGAVARDVGSAVYHTCTHHSTINHHKQILVLRAGSSPTSSRRAIGTTRKQADRHKGAAVYNQRSTMQLEVGRDTVTIIAPVLQGCFGNPE